MRIYEKHRSWVREISIYFNVPISLNVRDFLFLMNFFLFFNMSIKLQYKSQQRRGKFLNKII